MTNPTSAIITKSKRRRALVAEPTRAVDTCPDQYALVLDGDCLEPLLHDGTALVMQKSADYTVGDVVCVHWRDETRTPWIKRLKVAAPPWVASFPYRESPKSEVKALVVLEQMNPIGWYAVPCEEIYAIHKVVGWACTSGRGVDPDRLFPIGAPRLPTFLR